MARRPTREPPPEPVRKGRMRGRDVREPELIDRILEFQYRKLFGLKGQMIIASVVVFGLIVKFVVGIGSVSLDPLTCELAWYDGVYKLLHKERILTNTRRDLSKLLVEKLTIARRINAGRNPFPSVTDGNVVGGRKINKDKFFWRAYIANLNKERTAISKCLGRLPYYRFE